MSSLPYLHLKTHDFHVTLSVFLGGRLVGVHVNAARFHAWNE